MFKRKVIHISFWESVTIIATFLSQIWFLQRISTVDSEDRILRYMAFVGVHLALSIVDLT